MARQNHVVPDLVGEPVLGPFFVLGGDQHLLNRHWHAAGVPDGDLRLAVGPEEGPLAGFPHIRQLPSQPVRQRDRHRHQLGRLVRRVAEHHPLIACAHPVQFALAIQTACLVRHVDALGDVRRLPVQRDQNRAGVAVESALGGVADVPYGRPDDLGDIQVRRSGDLAGHEHESGGQHRLAGHSGIGVRGQRRIQDRVRYLIGDLVGMAFCHRFGGEQELTLVEADCHRAATPLFLWLAIVDSRH